MIVFNSSGNSSISSIINYNSNSNSNSSISSISNYNSNNMTIGCDTCGLVVSVLIYLWRCWNQDIVPSLNGIGPTCPNCPNGHLNQFPNFFCAFRNTLLNAINGILPNGYQVPGGPPAFNINQWGVNNQAPGHGGGGMIVLVSTNYIIHYL